MSLQSKEATLISPKGLIVGGLIIKLNKNMGELDVVNFTNVDNEDFEGSWALGEGNSPEIIKAGETRQIVSFKAKHYAKQLAVKILKREDKDYGNESPLLAKKIDEILGQVSAPAIATPTEPEKPAEPEFAETPKEEPKVGEVGEKSPIGVKCDVCGKVVKNEFALRMHRGRFHK